MQRSPYLYKSAFARSFPAPSYLTMPAVGIDISDFSIKYVALRRHRDAISLKAHGKIDLPLGTVERGEVKDATQLTKLLARLRDELDTQFVHLALPEEHAYLFETQLPAGKRAEMTQVLEFHLKENVPIGAEEAVFDYSVVNSEGSTVDANVSVYPTGIAELYISALEQAGFHPISVEIEGQATARALLAPDEPGATLIIDVGRNQASLSITKDGVVTFTANLETGGDVFTRAIARTMDISFQEAERLKREHGFRDTKEHEMIYEALLPAVADLKDSVDKHLMYWQMHATVNGEAEEQIGRVILVGGSANIAGVSEYLEAELEVPVRVGDVWTNVFKIDEHVPDMRFDQSLEYATAIGLALRSLVRGS